MKKVQKKKPLKKVSLIYVRNIDDKDNTMLNELKQKQGFGKSNATNVLRASYKFLELTAEVKNLKSEMEKLRQDNARKDQVYHSIKSEILGIMESEIKATKNIQKQKEAFYRTLKKTGKKLPRSLSFGRSGHHFFD